MGAATVALTLGRTPVETIGALLIMGVGGTLLLITIQAALSDHHGERREDADGGDDDPLGHGVSACIS